MVTYILLSRVYRQAIRKIILPKELIFAALEFLDLSNIQVLGVNGELHIIHITF